MKKCIVAPDSFKGTMSSIEVSDIISDVLQHNFPQCELLKIPIADGGEGTVDCFLRSVGGEKVYVKVKDAFGKDVRAYYGKLDDLAIIEMASVAGMVSNEKRNPLTAGTFGVGQLIEHAVSSGCRHIFLGLGGSCTNDAGAGMAAALGTVFTGADGKEFVPVGGNLDKVSRIDNSATQRKLRGVCIRCMCDTTAVMFGPKGAAYVYAAQKGADENQIKLLDGNLKAFAATIRRELAIDVSTLAAGGAAGAMGAGAVAFLNARLDRGIDIILDLAGFDDALRGCDCVFTGEGCIDAQSPSGKAVSGVASRAAKAGVPVIAFTGHFKEDEVCAEELGLAKVVVTAKPGQSLAQIKKSCRHDLKEAAEQLVVSVMNQEKL